MKDKMYGLIYEDGTIYSKNGSEISAYTNISTVKRLRTVINNGNCYASRKGKVKIVIVEFSVKELEGELWKQLNSFNLKVNKENIWKTM